MAIPKLSEQNILDALKYIDEHGVPFRNKSTVYELVSSEGKKYPPKYVIAVAANLATGRDIRTDDFNAVEAKTFFETRGYTIESAQAKYELVITAEDITSTDERFTFPNLVNFETDATRDNRMFALLLFLFPSYLSTAMRKGLFKTYVTREYNDANVRGMINVERHIRLNTPFTGKIAYSQREYTYNNSFISSRKSGSITLCMFSIEV